MNSYQITAQGTPIVPYTISIDAPINVKQVLINNITVPYTINSQDFLDTCALVVLNAENAYKTLPEFTTQDVSRNGTYTTASTGGFTYDITMSWDITNAEITLTANTTTDLQGVSLSDYLQILADSKVQEFKTQWVWTDL